MCKTRYSQEEIIRILQEVESGRPVKEVCREYGVSHWFLNLHDARKRIEAWRVDYNRGRPHGSLGHLTPKEYARGAGLQPEKPASVPPPPPVQQTLTRG